MAKDEFTRSWITDQALAIIPRYEGLTLRGLHYQLVNRGMTNSMRHYKRVVHAMIQARREGLVPYDSFLDHDRNTIGDAKAEETILADMIIKGREQVELWMTAYDKNKWENQDYYVEVWIEKKALIGVFQDTCKRAGVMLCPCKGYPSLTYLNNGANRFRAASSRGQKSIILYFGDYDPSGEDIPRSIQDNMYNDFHTDVEVDRIALMEEQVVEMGLPPAPTKSDDSRSATWDGLGQVELDAVDPGTLKDMVQDSVDKYFDEEAYNDLLDQESKERKKYVKNLKEYVASL